MTQAQEEQLELEEVEEDEVEEEFVPEPIWLPNGSPMFIGEYDDIIDQVRELGYSIFYVLGSYKFPTEHKNQYNTVIKGWSDPEPRLFKVTSNIVGHSCSTVRNDDMDLAELDSEATFKLPKVPYVMIQKLDHFFRVVEDKHGTEAIVMLTYDPQVGGSEGWGFMVPKQENSSGHCDYKPESVVDDLVDLNEGKSFEDQIQIVGTAHSHPGMSAFASHTDHKDQVNNDGLHITFGWKKGSNLTEHYIELQFSGATFLPDDDMIFEDAPEPPSFPEVEDWISNVKKKSFSGTSGTSGSGTYNKGGYRSPWPWESGGSTFSSQRSGSAHYDQNNKPFELPDGCPDPRENTVVVRLLNAEEDRCPVCDNPFLKGAKEDRRRCWDCMTFLLMPDEKIEEIVAMRSEGKMPTFELRPDKEPAKSIKIWERKVEDGKTVSSTTDFYDAPPEASGKD